MPSFLLAFSSDPLYFGYLCPNAHAYETRDHTRNAIYLFSYSVIYLFIQFVFHCHFHYISFSLLFSLSQTHKHSHVHIRPNTYRDIFGVDIHTHYEKRIFKKCWDSNCIYLDRTEMNNKWNAIFFQLSPCHLTYLSQRDFYWSMHSLK